MILKLYFSILRNFIKFTDFGKFNKNYILNLRDTLSKKYVFGSVENSYMTTEKNILPIEYIKEYTKTTNDSSRTTFFLILHKAIKKLLHNWESCARRLQNVSTSIAKFSMPI